jgi:hypothetical protein
VPPATHATAPRKSVSMKEALAGGGCVFCCD